MKRILFLSFCISTLCLQRGLAQNTINGEKIFKASCSACHSIGKGKIVGPDLMNVSTRRKEPWLIKFIRSSQMLVKGGDPVAVKLFNDHNKIPMPDQNLTDAQIKDVLAYIKSKSAPVTVKTITTKPSGTTTSTKPSVTTNTKPTTVVKEKDDWIDAEYKLKSYAVQHEINPKELNAEFWTKIEASKLPVSPQQAAYPTLNNASIEFLTVKSVYRPMEVAFLIEWNDSSKNNEVDVVKFCDQFAVEFPLNTKEIPSYMMGNKDGMVHIVHWKAIWQEDCEKGFQDVQVKYPNMWVDVYPGLESYLDRSKRIYAQDITAEMIVETHATGNMPGTYSHNPMSQIKRKYPVEEANAEGFGTIATQETQQAKAWAEWKDGKWKVCVVVPVNTGNRYKATFTDRTKVAFALWDGGFQNIGGRKHFIPWVDLLLQK